MAHDHRQEHGNAFKSRFGIVLICFLMIAGFLLAFEHRAHLFAGPWLLWLLPLVCLVMHFAHGHSGDEGEA